MKIFTIDERRLLGMLAAGHGKQCVGTEMGITVWKVAKIERANKWLRFGLPLVEPKTCICKYKRTVWSFGGP